MENKKRDRIIAKRLLTRAQNRLFSAINAGNDIEIINSRFTDIITLRKNTELKHEEYIASFNNATEEIIKQEDEWIDAVENEFVKVEKMKIEYGKLVRNTANVELKKEIPSDDERETSMATSIRLRTMEEVLFKQILGDFFNLLKSTEVDVSLIKDSHEQIKASFNRCKELQNQFISIINRDPNAEEMDWIKRLQTLLSEVNIAFGKYLKSIENSKDDGDKAQSILDRKLKNTLKIQPLKLPNFDGNVRSYPIFKQDFKRLIEPRMSDDLTCSYVLKSCLSEAVAEVVKNLDKSEDIWLRLDERFGRPSKLIDSVMNELQSLKRIQEDDDSALINLVDVIETAHRDLCMIGVEKEISNSSCVSMIEAKLPKAVKRDWSKVVNGKDDLLMSKDLFPHLLKFLQDQRRIIEYEMSCLRNTDDSKEGSSFHVTSDIKRGFSCWVHGSNGHTIEDCRTYNDANATEKVKLLKDKRACWSCLKLGHRSVDCNTRKKCTETGCEKYHHHSLHEANQQGLILHAVKHNDSNTNDPCLLQLMEIESSLCTPLNVLWDAGATVSLITFEKAEQLKLKGKKCKLSIAGVGGKVQDVASYAYKLAMRNEEGNSEEFAVYGVKHISSGISQIDLKQVVSLFKNITEAEVRRPQGSIDVLMGYDYAAFHPRVQESNGHLLLLCNQFGKCIGGRHPLVKEATCCSSMSVNHASIGVVMNDFLSMW